MKNTIIADGVRCLCLQDTRFKTMRLSVGMFLPLKEDTAASFAILPELLTRATAASPTMAALHRRVSRLYGAVVSSGVARIGEHQVLTIGITCVDNRFALNGEDVATSCVDLLQEMLFSPHLSANNAWDATDFEQEKRCLKERIAASFNDKRVYARERAEALMANGEAYGVSPQGTVQTAENLTAKQVFEAWETVLKTAFFQFVYVGSDNGAQVVEQLHKMFGADARAVDSGKTVTDFEPLSIPRVCHEYMTVNQAKLCMCFRLSAAEPDADAVATGRVLAALFGGSPFSLLFRNVREKMSLCYYCSASYERVKGVLIVNSGVDAANVDRAKAEILRQMETIQNGDFTDEDLDNAKRYLIHHLRERENVQGGMVNWYMGQALSDCPQTVEQAVLLIEKVDKAQVAALAKTVNLQSVFVVAPKEESV